MAACANLSSCYLLSCIFYAFSFARLCFTRPFYIGLSFTRLSYIGPSSAPLIQVGLFFVRRDVSGGAFLNSNFYRVIHALNRQRPK